MSVAADLIAASATLCGDKNLLSEDYDRRLRDHTTYLRQLILKNDLSSLAHDQTLLEQFDASNDSITYLLLLRLQIHTLRETSGGTPPAELLPFGTLWSKSAHYLEIFDPIQVRYAGHEWLQLIDFMMQAAQAASKPLLVARMIKDALLRLDPSCAVLTSTHVLLTELCLTARTYTCALPVLDRHILHMPVLPNCDPSGPCSVLCAEHDSSMSFMNETTGLTSRVSYKDYLQYFLYGGMIFLALKEWRKALHFLGAVISMPTIGSVSMIMVEAYKKWVLVGLLEKGKLCSPPSMTAPHVFKTFQALSKPYIALAHAFECGDVKIMEAEVDAAKEVWCMDNNMGLVSQVVNAYSTHSLIKAKKVFTTLTMAELSAHTPLLRADVNGVGEAHIASLVVSEDTDATLVHSNANSTDTMLRFGDLSSLLKMPRETNIQAQFKQEGQLLEGFFGGVEGNSNRLGLCDEFLDGVLRGQSWPSGGGMNLLGTGGNGGVGLEMEEDIMGDLS